MLRTLRGSKKVLPQDLKMLAEFLIASWLNTGFRQPACFGFVGGSEQLTEFEFLFWQACRILFEHVMMLQLIPTKH